jgi:membrane-associated protease RseP (regulator of RpoE activity)
VLIAIVAILLAQAPPTLGNPAPDTGSHGAPVTVNDCSFSYRYYYGRAYVAPRGLKIEFTDESAKPVDLVTFAVTSNIGSATIRDVGEVEPGVETTHEFRQFDRTQLFSVPEASCTVQAVHFTDGTVWQYGASQAASTETSTLLGLVLVDGASGVLVKFVAPGSAGAAAGIRQGDRIVSIGSNAVSSVSDVKTIFSITSSSTPLPIVLDRGGQAVNATIHVSAGPVKP